MKTPTPLYLPFSLIALTCAVLLLLASHADAQQTAKVLATCGTASGYVAGGTNYVTIDTTGAACSAAASGSPTTVQGSASNASSGVATSATNVPTVSYNYIWNGTTWDQVRSAGMIGSVSVGGAAASGATASNPIPIGITDGAIGIHYQTTAAAQTDANTGSTNAFIGLGIFNGASYDRMRSIVGAIAAGTGNAAVDIAPTSAAPAAITPSISASSAATSLVAKASAGNYYDAYCQSTAAGRCIVYNATAAPGAGALTAALVLDCAVVAAGGQGSVQYGDIPRRASAGITVLFSSSTDCNTYTASSTAYIHASVQ